MKVRLFVFLVALVCAVAPLRAQIKVDLKLPHRLMLAYEPILATVSVTNLTGRDIELRDTETSQWFGFQILNYEDTPVPPRDLHYKLEPLVIEAGQTVKRQVNLVTLYPITEFGLYRVRATIFFMNRYFTSPAQNIEVTEGKTIWRQTVGVPESDPDGGLRIYNVMTHRLPNETRIYVRVEDKERNLVYATHAVGKLVFGETPEVRLDDTNKLHILHLAGPRTYLHTQIGLNGEFLSQTTFTTAGKTRPHLQKRHDGTIAVAGGNEQKPPGSEPTPPPAKLSDRPVNLPKL